MRFFNFRLEGQDRVQAAMDWRRRHLLTEGERTIHRALEMIERTTKRQFLSLSAPGSGGLAVRTGRLRSSIGSVASSDAIFSVTRQGRDIRGEIGTRVFYGIAWEKGTVKDWQGNTQEARPFLMPSKEINAPKIRDRFRGLVKVVCEGPQ
jgi:hypothetical protein